MMNAIFDLDFLNFVKQSTRIFNQTCLKLYKRKINLFQRLKTSVCSSVDPKLVRQKCTSLSEQDGLNNES